MSYFKIDFRKDKVRVSSAQQTLKWIVIVYVVSASVYLFIKLYHLLFGSGKVIWYEWIAVMVNLLLVLILAYQLIKLSKVRYLIIGTDAIKFAKFYPWSTRISWEKCRQIQFGYTNIRFVTKKGKRYRFSLVKMGQADKDKLLKMLNNIADKYNIDLMEPLL